MRRRGIPIDANEAESSNRCHGGIEMMFNEGNLRRVKEETP